MCTLCGSHTAGDAICMFSSATVAPPPERTRLKPQRARQGVGVGQVRGDAAGGPGCSHGLAKTSSPGSHAQARHKVHPSLSQVGSCSRPRTRASGIDPPLNSRDCLGSSCSTDAACLACWSCRGATSLQNTCYLETWLRHSQPGDHKQSEAGGCRKAGQVGEGAQEA